MDCLTPREIVRLRFALSTLPRETMFSMCTREGRRIHASQRYVMEWLCWLEEEKGEGRKYYFEPEECMDWRKLYEEMVRDCADA